MTPTETNPIITVANRQAMVRIVHPIKGTRLFRQNQKCWIMSLKVAMACQVIGKYQGKGRYVIGWLHAPREYDPASVKAIEVDEEFAKRLGI